MTGTGLSVYIEPRDAWVGAYVAQDAIYVCPLPFLVLRWRWKAPAPQAPPAAPVRDPASTTAAVTERRPTNDTRRGAADRVFGFGKDTTTG